MSRSLTVAPFNWSDQVDISSNVEDQLVEAFFTPNDYSFATYFDQVTFGFVDIRAGARVLRRNTLSIEHQLFEADGTWHSAVERQELYEAAVRWFMTENPETHFGPPMDDPSPLVPGFPTVPGKAPASPWVIFMLIGPSPAGSIGEGVFCVLDWHATFDYMAHELGHALGWVHSRGDYEAYDDPYCIMSAQDYAGTNPTHTRVRAPGSIVPDNPGGPSFWGGGFGPMPAAATLVRELPEFRASPMVVRVQPDQRVTLRALSEARRGDPVVAAMEYENEWWMAELRVATNWDRGLVGNPNSPGEGVILHTWSVGGADGAVYRGRVDTRDPLRPSFQPTWSTRMKLVVDYYDPGAKSVELHFTEGPPPYSFGSPAPEFAPYHPECIGSAGEVVTLQEAFAMGDSGQVNRLRFEVSVTHHDGSATQVALASGAEFNPGYWYEGNSINPPGISHREFIMWATECVGGAPSGRAWRMTITAGEHDASWTLQVNEPLDIGMWPVGLSYDGGAYVLWDDGTPRTIRLVVKKIPHLH